MESNPFETNTPEFHRNSYYSNQSFILSSIDSYHTESLGQISLSNIENNSININKNEGEIIDDILDLMKCYICLEKVKNPKMCNFCHRLVCGSCISKWLNITPINKCGFVVVK